MYQALAASSGEGAWIAWLDLRHAPRLGQVVYAAPIATGAGGAPVPGRNVEVYASPGRSVCECCDVGVASDGTGRVAVAFRNSLPDGTRDACLAPVMEGSRSGRSRWGGDRGRPPPVPWMLGRGRLLGGEVLAVAGMDRRAGESESNVRWSLLPGGLGAAPGASWPPEALIHNAGAGRQSHPALAVDESGTVIAAWEDGRSGPTAIAAALSRSPSRNFLLSEPAGGKASFPALAAGKGIAAAVYEAGGGVWIRVFDPRAW